MTLGVYNFQHGIHVGGIIVAGRIIVFSGGKEVDGSKLQFDRGRTNLLVVARKEKRD